MKRAKRWSGSSRGPGEDKSVICRAVASTERENLRTQERRGNCSSPVLEEARGNEIQGTSGRARPPRGQRWRRGGGELEREYLHFAGLQRLLACSVTRVHHIQLRDGIMSQQSGW